MNSKYKISFRAKIKTGVTFQRLHDCLKQLNVKQWGYDCANYTLTLTSEVADFKRIQNALIAVGCVCHFLKLENLSGDPGLMFS